ncbi:MAG: NAD-dependent succinate-semialdehyde dehydrogenase [Deltaproteobacteria bacterium]|nr:NAD-dependent succinate-semialdehyde dehydrogenase [Deltaproteobacteria bacterium]
MPFQSINPATGELCKTYPETPRKEAERAAEEIHEGFHRWRRIPLSERAPLLKNLAQGLKKGKSRLAPLITQEMGKPIGQAEAEVEKCAWVTDFYADHAADYLNPKEVTSDASKSYIRYDPLGVILAIMPWNFPFWQVFRCAVPSLVAGNAIILKHAPNVPGCAIAIEELFTQAGLKEIFCSLFASLETTARLIESPFVQGVSLTGSDRAGSQVAALAGKHLKKVALELGGSDPFIVLEDADLKTAIPAAIAARMQNSGQSCIAAKRFLVTEKIAKKFEQALVEAVQEQKIGDPMDLTTTIGPIARADLLTNLVRQVEESRKQGAKVLVGGERWGKKGFFYLPTVLEEVRPGICAFEEETFGPVASLTTVKDENEAVALANKTAYGLGASLWTKDLAKAERLASQIEAGAVFINGVVHSDPRLPFGGIKRSGYGRELGREGILEFTNVKTVWIK